jgi:DNA-binding response OmpR family regulator
MLAEYLRRAGYEVVDASDGFEALKVFQKYHPALVVLDVMMPELDGWEVLRELRERSEVPVLMLTGFADESYQLEGFNLGADDYVTKPFSPRQVVLRVKAILRRTSPQKGRPLICGPITLDPSAHTVTVNNRPVSLTAREYSLLHTFITNQGRVFTRGELLNRCWEQDGEVGDRVVDVHIASLRRKLGRKRLITTVHGVGYRLERP